MTKNIYVTVLCCGNVLLCVVRKQNTTSCQKGYIFTPIFYTEQENTAARSVCRVLLLPVAAAVNRLHIVSFVID